MKFVANFLQKYYRFNFLKKIGFPAKSNGNPMLKTSRYFTSKGNAGIKFLLEKFRRIVLPITG